MSERPYTIRRKLRPAPNLQDLVAQYGRYDLIPPEAWAKFDADMAAWKEDLRAGNLEIPDDV
jgi:hypothetical protein